MTEELERLLATACRLGDDQADLLAKKDAELRALRRVMWQAYKQLRSGRPDSARLTLKQALDGD